MGRMDKAYFAQRAAEEFSKSRAATHPDARRAHALLARGHLEKASIGDRPGTVPDEDHLFADKRSSFSKVFSDA